MFQRLALVFPPWLCLAASFAPGNPWASWLFVRCALVLWGVAGIVIAFRPSHAKLAHNLRRFPVTGALLAAAVASGGMYAWSKPWFHPVWVPLVFAAAHVAMSQKRPLVPALALLLGGLFTAGSVELGLVAIRNSQFLAGHPVLNPLARKIYRSDWAVAHLDPACAQDDAELLYTLRPGECSFRNLEFDTRIRINRLGVRDDEESLRAPVIVVLGDSQAMGWGIGGDDTFASRLEKSTGLPVLNTAIASYGTPRELALLKRVDLSRARYLVIQYSANDQEENAAFEKNGYRLLPHHAGEHSATMEWYRKNRQYRPGKYLAYGLRGAEAILARRLRRPPASANPPVSTPRPGPRGEEMRLFVEALLHSPVDLSRFTIFVFELASHELPRGGAEAIRGAIEAHPARQRLANVTVLDFAAVLGTGDFLAVDGHTTASAHAKVAAELARQVAGQDIVGTAP